MKNWMRERVHRYSNQMRDLLGEFAAQAPRDAHATSESLQFLAGLEPYSLAGRDADFLAGARISSDAGFAGTHVEYPEAAQLDSLAFAQSALHGPEDSLDGLLRFGPAHTSPINHRIHDIEFDHNNLPLFDGKLC
jgi:hypothetical protein